MQPYATLPPDRQVAVLTEVATRGAAAFGLAVDDLSLVLHGYNTTFKVTSGGVPHAIRVNTNSKASSAHLMAQLAWIRAIAAQTEVLVPNPLQTSDGADYALVDCPTVGGDVVVVANAWLDGADLGDLPDAPEVALAALGSTMAALHTQAERWTPPSGFELPRFTDPLFGDANLIDTSSLSAAARGVLNEAFARTTAAFERLGAEGVPMLPIHADLHGANVKWHHGQLAVFDFDDCGIGPRLLDLAITLFYLRDGSDAQAAFLRGYASRRPLPEAEPELLETLIASRQLLLANSLFDNSNAELLAEAPGYLATSVARLERWLGTGSFVR